MHGIRRQNVIVRGEAGSGKSTLMKGYVTMLWGDEALEDKSDTLIVISGGSDKSMLNDAMEERFRDSTHLYVTEIQNLYSGKNSTAEDILKAFGEFEPYIYKRTDVTAREEGQNSGMKEFLLKPLPVITTLADDNQRLNEDNGFNEEMNRRYVSVDMEANINMNRMIHERLSAMEALPSKDIFTMSPERRRAISSHITDVIEADFDLKLSMRNGIDIDDIPPRIKNPCAPYVQDTIPKKFTISNTIINYWHEFVRGVTSFYFKDRIIDDGILFSTPQDNAMAWIVYGQSVINQCLHIKGIGLSLIDVIPLRAKNVDFGIMSSNNDAGMTLNEIKDALTEKGIEKTTKQLKSYIMKLVMPGYIKVDNKGKNDIYYKSRSYENEFIYGVNWRNVVAYTDEFMHKYYGDVADEYHDRFLVEPRIIHPITGEDISIYDIGEVENEVECRRVVEDADIDKMF